MNSALLAALVLYSMTTSAFQTSRCQQQREKCSATIQCESIWKATEEACSIPGTSCAVEESINCNKFIEFLVTQYPEFKDCNCTKDGCNIQMLLGKECFSNKGQPALLAAPNVWIGFPKPTTSDEIAHPSIFENDCFIAKEICQKDNACFLLYRHFEKMCHTEGSACSCQTVGHQCFKAWQDLKKTILGGCKCPEPGHEKCTGIWENIFNNSCLKHTPEYQASSLNKNAYANVKPQRADTDHKSAEAEWKWSALLNAEYKPQHSCLRVNVECISDPICNRQFSLYLDNCQASGMPCSVDRCRTALRNFYKNMPFNVAQKLTFCDCEELDEKCLHAKELLHGKPYTDLVQASSCLSVIQTCQGDSLCREKYNAFTSECLKDIFQSCFENNACIEYLAASNFNCSDTVECRKAYIDLWGVLRPTECTCDMSSPTEQSTCKLFHHTLQRNPCFSQIAGRKAVHYPLHTDQLGIKRPATHKESLFAGNKINIAIYSYCVILTLGLVLLALLKTRAFKTKAKAPSATHLSERLMIPQQPWIVNCVANDLPGSSHSQPVAPLP